MAVELCKVSLWMEAMEPGKPLSFLDHHIKCGNSLFGATPKLISDGIPDEAFTPIEGDDKGWASVLKKRNKAERSGQTSMFGTLSKASEQAELANKTHRLSRLNDDSILSLRLKEKQYEVLTKSPEYKKAQLVADAWCSAFVWKKDRSAPPSITQDIFRRLSTTPEALPTATLNEISLLSEQYSFFHWHIAFPDVFTISQQDGKANNTETGWSGGFDLVIGNPPWEAEELIEKEFFSTLIPEIATVRTKAKRTDLIDMLRSTHPEIIFSWENEKRKYAARSQFYKLSDLFKRGSGGKLNTYRLFAELASLLPNEFGYTGQVLKTGIVTAQDSQPLFQHWTTGKRVVSVFDFINTNLLFRSVVSNERFCLLTLSGSKLPIAGAEYMFTLTNIEQIKDNNIRVRVKSDELKCINPDDLSVPPVSGPRDYKMLLAIHRKHPTLRSDKGNWNPWQLHYTQGHLNSASGSTLFKDSTLELLLSRDGIIDSTQIIRLGEEVFIPLYEGKFIGQMNHRFGTFNGTDPAQRFGTKAETNDPSAFELIDPDFEIQPRYWLRSDYVSQLYKQKGTKHQWLFGFRDVCRAIVDARTIQACILPRVPCLDGCPLLVFESNDSIFAASSALILNSLWSSFVYDYAARQKIHGAHLTKAIAYQLPTPTPETFKSRFLDGTFQSFIFPNSLELTVVTNSLLPFAKDCGYTGPPFRWDEERRFLLRCELDAAYFHLYGIERDDVDYIMETFPIVKRKDEQHHGEFRTKKVILEIYDAMAEAIRLGKPYQTRLAPPPADPSVAHPPKDLVKHL